MIDVGGYGKNSDGSIFVNSNFSERFRKEKFNFPNDDSLPSTKKPMSYIIVENKAFPFHKNLLKPYPGNAFLNNKRNEMFNYRLN